MRRWRFSTPATLLNRKRFKTWAALVIAYHLVWTAYGTWLPNDPRGSGSRDVASPLLAELGELHYGRRRLQPAGKVVREFYEHAEERLTFPVARFDRAQIEDIAEAFSAVIAESVYTCYACAILPDHVHMVIRKHRHQAEEMIERLQSTSRAGLNMADHPVWTRGGWRRFLNTPPEVRRLIPYVERNPRTPQSWPFVTPYDNWPHHEQVQ